MISNPHLSTMKIIPISTLNSHQLLIFLIQLAILLFCAMFLGKLARKYRMPSLVGEVCAGIILGPSILGQISPYLYQLLFPQITEQFHLLDAVGQLGVILLVGLGGIGLNINLLRKRSVIVTRIGLFSAVIPFICGFIVGYFLPISVIQSHVHRFIIAMFIGITMSVSAIPVLTKTLIDMRLLHKKIGQIALPAAAIDDTIGWLLLSVVTILQITGSINNKAFLLSIISLVILLILSWVVGRKIVHKILSLMSREGEGPKTTALVSMILAYAAITQFMGLEAVFGALICGILIRSYPSFREIRLPTILWVLSPLFFATVGLRINLTALNNISILLTAIYIILIAVVSKFAATYIGARLSRLKHRESLALGAAMNARGIVEVVIANVGIQIGILNVATYTIIILVALVTSLMAAPVLYLTVANVRLKGKNI